MYGNNFDQNRSILTNPEIKAQLCGYMTENLSNAYDDHNCIIDPFLWTLCILFSFFLPLLQKEKTMHHYDAATDVKNVVM